MDHGHQISAVWTCRDEQYYGASPEHFRLLAERFRAPFRQDLEINGPEGITWLQRSGAEIGISINWLTLISSATIQSLPHKILNAHAGDLPKYRGNACANWAMLNGEDKIGLTVHEMAQELDAGPILLKSYYELNNNTYISDIFKWFELTIPKMFVEALDGIMSGAIKPIVQSTDPKDSLRCYPRRPEDGHIDWSWSTNKIHLLIRASSRPFDGAFTTLDGLSKVTIWRADPVETEGPFCAQPGQVCYRIGNDPVVACADGMLRLTEITVEGHENSEDGKRAIHKSLRNRLI